MLKEIEDYLAQAKSPQEAVLNDPFAERLVGIAKELAFAVRRELGMAGESPKPGPPDPKEIQGTKAE